MVAVRSTWNSDGCSATTMRKTAMIAASANQDGYFFNMARHLRILPSLAAESDAPASLLRAALAPRQSWRLAPKAFKQIEAITVSAWVVINASSVSRGTTISYVFERPDTGQEPRPGHCDAHAASYSGAIRSSSPLHRPAEPVTLLRASRASGKSAHARSASVPAVALPWHPPNQRPARHLFAEIHRL